MKNQKIKLFIVCLCTIVVSAMSLKSFAQNVSDYKGVWHAIDKSGNLIELQLNSNYTCSFNINGVSSYHITAFKLVPSLNSSANSTQSPAMDIWFYASTNSTGSQNLNSSVSSSGILIYKASTKLSGNKMDLKVVLDATTESVTEFNFSK